MSSRPRRISTSFLAKKKASLTDAEYKALKEEYAQWESFESAVQTKLGYRLNAFAFRGETECTVFVRKDGRKWLMMTFDEAWEKLQ